MFGSVFLYLTQKQYDFCYIFPLYRPSIASIVPAATAVPMTPATFGPMACMRRKLPGFAFAPTTWLTRAAIGTAETPAEPIRRRVRA